MKLAKRLRLRQRTGDGRAIYAEKNAGVWTAGLPRDGGLVRFSCTNAEVVGHLARLAVPYGGAAELDAEAEDGSWQPYKPGVFGRNSIRRRASA